MRMLHTTIFLFISHILTTTLVIPIKYKNYRMSYKNGLKFINSAANESTRIDDYFKINDQITLLSNEGMSMCATNEKLDLCPTSSKGVRIWKIADAARTVQFRDENGDCLTVGPHDDMFDTFDVIRKGMQGR